MRNDIKAKRIRDRNQTFLPEAREKLEKFESGELESMIIFSRNAEGEVDITYSYSETFEGDAAALMTMGMLRMGFKAGS